ncbi:PH domain-containing protein [Flavobacterium sp. 3HN19-14]|uniref:PH domain-containing protein n=1 Tax=Flavobacterium sp. 3HN19-14 TaxID=3448133 RepID=UPI003EE0A234
MQVFDSRKNKFTVIFLGAMAILIPLPLLLTFGETDLKTEIFLGFLFFGISGFFVWILFDTKYKIDAELMYFASGPFRGKIKIASIRRIEYDKSWFKTSFYKPALHQDGLMIYYDKFEDIFIAPKDKEGFIAALKAINPEIEITKSTPLY